MSQEYTEILKHFNQIWTFYLSSYHITKIYLYIRDDILKTCQMVTKLSLINKFPSNLGLQNAWLIINCLPTWSISCTKARYNWWQRPQDICFPLTGHLRYPMNVFSHSTPITAKLAISALSNTQREHSLEQCMHHVRMHMIYWMCFLRSKIGNKLDLLWNVVKKWDWRIPERCWSEKFNNTKCAQEILNVKISNLDATRMSIYYFYTRNT